MIEIIAHRALFNGKENSIEGVKHYKKLGIGVELDLRNGKNGVYMSHDPHDKEELFQEVCKVCFDSKIKMALHIKEIESIKETIKLLKEYSIQNCFLFNTDEDITKRVDGFQVAEYVNEEKKIITQELMWCDETKNTWYNNNILKLHKEGKKLYAMSLEIINPLCTKQEMISDWDRLIKMKIDGICSNHPEELRGFLKEGDLN